MTATFPAAELKEKVSLKSLFERDNHDLKKAGADTWKCRCPFHAEKTASCVVHDEKGFFKCFACNARGTIIEYWALARGLDKDSQFPEVCRQLSELVLGHAVPPPQKRATTDVKEPKRPAPLGGRDLQKWQEGCRWLAENVEAQTGKPRGMARLSRGDGAHAGGAGEDGDADLLRRTSPAFAVECVDEKGEPYLAGWHVRLEPKPDDTRPMWHFVPRGIGSWPFVIGYPVRAACW